MQIYHFWIKTYSFKFSVFAKQEEAASRCSYRLWQQRRIMLWSGITLVVIQFPFIILSQGITVKMPQE